MRLLALACLGGALGAGLRHWINTAFLARGLVDFPWSTFVINVTGSFLMGVLVAVLHAKAIASPELRTFLATGILGGYTTFSAYSLDVVTLIERNEHWAAAAYAGGSVVLSVAGLALGIALARWVIA